MRRDVSLRLNLPIPMHSTYLHMYIYVDRGQCLLINLSLFFFFTSPFPLHHRELPKRPVRLRQRQQRHLLLLVRLLQPRWDGVWIVRLGIWRLLPL